jgi:hypothetical protein
VVANEQRVELAIRPSSSGPRPRRRTPCARAARSKRFSASRFDGGERSSSFARIARSCSYWIDLPDRPAGPRRAKWFSMTSRKNSRWLAGRSPTGIGVKLDGRHLPVVDDFVNTARISGTGKRLNNARLKAACRSAKLQPK